MKNIYSHFLIETRPKNKKNKLQRMAKQLAAEKAKSAALTKKLKQSRKDNEELVAGLNKLSESDGGSTNCSTLELEDGNGFSSTRNTGANYEDTRINSRNVAATSQDESTRFLSSINQLSVASINVPECKPTDDGDIHRQTYELWKDLLIDSMTLAGIEDEQTRFTVFKVKAGIKLLEIFRNTKSQSDDPDPVVRPFSNALQRLKSYFGSGSDVMLMRRKLALMTQRADETDLAYITRVGSMARLCGYDDNKEFEEIVATIAEHAREKEVRTTALKMLSKKGTFTDLVDKIREIESIRLNEEYVMRKRGRPDQALVATINTPSHRQRFQDRFQPGQASMASANNSFRYQQRFGDRNQTRYHPYQRGMQSARGRWQPPRGDQFRDGRSGPMSVRCWRCESVFHSPNNCTAKGKVCLQCGQLGHIRRACKAPGKRGDVHSFGQQQMTSNEESSGLVATIEKTEEIPAEDEKVSELIEN